MTHALGAYFLTQPTYSSNCSYADDPSSCPISVVELNAVATHHASYPQGVGPADRHVSGHTRRPHWHSVRRSDQP
jgi:hypothetical protein